jgi:hypothetical protein
MPKILQINYKLISSVSSFMRIPILWPRRNDKSDQVGSAPGRDRCKIIAMAFL